MSLGQSFSHRPVFPSPSRGARHNYAVETIKTAEPAKQKHRAIIVLAMAATLLGISLLVDRNALTTQLEAIIGIFILGSLAIAWRDVQGRPIVTGDKSVGRLASVSKLFEFSLELLAVGFLWIVRLLATPALHSIWPIEVAFLLTCVYGAVCWRRSRVKRAAA